jgi:mRNA interferase MazF
LAKILRGDILWADLSPVKGHEQSGRRPVLVLSHDIFNERSGTVIAAALTSQEPKVGFPLTCELSDKKLPKKSWVKISQIRTLSVERLGGKLGRANPEELAQVVEGLEEIIGD